MLVQPIPITVESGVKDKELVLLEFQGEFEHTDLGGEAHFGGLDLGQLVEKAQGHYELTVGNHLLKGKVSDLARPMILTRTNNSSESAIDGKNINLEVQAVVRKKILFSTRPTPLNFKAGQGAAAQKSLGEKRRNLN